MPFFSAVAWNSEKPGEPYAPGAGFGAGFGEYIRSSDFSPLFEMLIWMCKGFYPLGLGMLSLVFLLGSLRTNLVFVFIFVFAILGFSFASAGLFYTALGDAEFGGKMVVATGACFFGADMLGWYLLFAIV